MKIACIGNMNNNMFCLVRYLRDRGFDAHLFLLDEFKHFLPEADSYNSDFNNYVHQLDWYDTGYWKIKPSKIKEDLNGFDFFIGSDLVPAFFKKAKIHLDIFIPHGGDIFNHAFFKFSGLIPKRWELGAFARARAQRWGIANSGYMMYDYTNDDAEYFIKKIGGRVKRFVASPPFIYVPQYTDGNFTKDPEFPMSCEVRKKYDFIIFHQCRHVWQSYKDTLHYKANDVLIRAYAAFVKKNPDKKCVLIMFEYGWDFELSKKLVTELKIENKVIWLKLMPRKSLMVWANIADLGVGELGRSWLSYGSVYELLALKKPFLGYREDSMYEAHYPEQYPMISANEVEAVEKVLGDYLKNPLHFVDMGKKSHEWFMKYAVNKPLKMIMDAINEK